jgi:glycosyltransferase involved in cell wall biosynthesis
LSALGIVIPVYNQESELTATLDALDAAVAVSPFRAEIVVVDDGSTDGSADVARAWSGQTVLRVVVQENAGRLAARRRGLDELRTEYCLLIDSRVRIHEGALSFVGDALPERDVWTADVEIEIAQNPFGTFWDVLTRRAWSEYFDNPRTTSFGVEAFERYPKGTTCFFAPRSLLVASFDAFRTGYRDSRYANDDTPLIRWIAERRPINVSPSYGCTYAPRQRMRPFLRHSFHRGIVFVDGHGRRESRWFPIVVAFFPLTIVWLGLSVLYPLLIVLPIVLAAVGGAVLAFTDGRGRAALTMAWVTPLYAVAHGLGMWRGLALAVRTRLTR